MTIGKYAVAVAFALTALGNIGNAKAEAGNIIEIFCVGGQCDVSCTGAECNLTCRELATNEVLQEAQFYSVGRGCTVTVTDGTQLNEVLEAMSADLLTAVQPAGAPTTGTTTTAVTFPGVTTTEADAPQTTPQNPLITNRSSPGLGATSP